MKEALQRMYPLCDSIWGFRTGRINLQGKFITVQLPLWMLLCGLRKGAKGKVLGLYLDRGLVTQVHAFVKIQQMPL